ncbi:hypothetical protein WP12_11755 [Sphingomonas sp. SRS2]|nr:hypothetical protein WP12_11755 [Sphingomonas sp. SRS2]
MLEDIELVLEPGSFTALVGPSGSGKSTLLHIAAGLDTGFDGQFRLDPPQATLAYMFQQPRLLPWKNARDNVALVLEVRGVPRAQAAEQASEILRRVGLGTALDVLPQQLSGGMQQRVALARALVIEPDVLLMDEPFSALDELTAAHLRRELLDLWIETKRTVLMVTHNIGEACELADRILVLSNRPGRVIADFKVDLPRPRRRSDPGLGRLSEQVLAAVEPSLAAPVRSNAA